MQREGGREGKREGERERERESGAVSPSIPRSPEDHADLAGVTDPAQPRALLKDFRAILGGEMIRSALSVSPHTHIDTHTHTHTHTCTHTHTHTHAHMLPLYFVYSSFVCRRKERETEAEVVYLFY